MNKPLLVPQQLHAYQRECIIHQLSHSDSMLWLGMGLGKTPVTLTTIVDRMRAGQVQKTLIVAPLRVIQAVWEREARKWSHTQHLSFSILHGTKVQRERALFANADIFLINYENLNWLAETLMHYYLSQDKPLPFQMVVYDEISKMKNSTSMRVAGGKRDFTDKRTGRETVIRKVGWRKILPHFKFRTGLTGTPASNGYMDLFGQYLAVDGGTRLGEYVTHFKDSYFAPDYMGWKYAPTELGKQWIEHKISDITVKMDAKDYLDLPAVKITNMMVTLPPAARKAYNEMEAEMFTQLDSGSELEVFSKAAVSNKCLQFCNGSPYNESGSHEYQSLHDAKLDALEEVLEEAGGSPVLVAYSFRADAERIMKKFKSYKPVDMTKTPSSQTLKVINEWNSGKIKLLIGHPACLHPGTQVLTQRRGWVKIIDVEVSDKVFDGVEFVSHDGCSYSGYKDVIDVLGITMTPNHRILINGEWEEGKDVDNSEDTRRKALYQYQGDDKSLSEMFTPLELREGHETCEHPSSAKAHVYDLVNCGPRHRFVVRNDDGDVFVSHNSMGHGVDGLQDSGSILAWFGLSWSLELYEQMCKRLDRQGQTAPVSIIRILCEDTVDLAVADAIERKTDDQEGLKDALQRYRAGHIKDLDTLTFM